MHTFLQELIQQNSKLASSSYTTVQTPNYTATTVKIFDHSFLKQQRNPFDHPIDHAIPVALNWLKPSLRGAVDVLMEMEGGLEKAVERSYKLPLLGKPVCMCRRVWSWLSFTFLREFGWGVRILF